MHPEKVLLPLTLCFVFFGEPVPDSEQAISSSQIASSEGTSGDFPDLSIRLQLPSGWVAFEAHYAVAHYRGVFLCVNNIGSHELRVQGSSRDDRLPRSLGAYNAEVVAEQLKPGTAYIDFGFSGRPGGGPQFSRGTRDNFDSVAGSLSPEDMRAFWRTNELTAHQINFFKWGRSWSIYIYFREPVGVEGRRAAFDLIKNMMFVDRPTTSQMPAQAIAFNALPEAVRDSVMMTPKDCNCCEPAVYPRCKPRGLNFEVTLEFGVRKWTYLVSRDGAATLVEMNQE